MYTIFKNDIVIILTDSRKNENLSNFYYWNKMDFKLLIQTIKKDEKMKLFLYHTDVEMMWNNFQKIFKVVVAAGGVVQNSKKKILFIYRHEKWDLPKGKVEKNENIEIAAIREVKEECGLQEVRIASFLEKTYHIYTENDIGILKITYWFSMFSNQNNFIPQKEEGISLVIWKNEKEVMAAMENTFPNIKLLLHNLNQSS